MNHKHFTFDLDYFPITNSNVFRSIKIQQKNKNLNSNKIGIKRYPLKNELNLQEIPDLMYFEKSTKKPKNKSEKQNSSPSSNQTKKSNTRSHEDIEWSVGKKREKIVEKERRVQSCPKPSQLVQIKLNQSLLTNSIKLCNQNDKQNQEQRIKTINNLRQFHRKSQKKSQLYSLQECESQFDESSEESLAISKVQKNKETIKKTDNEKQRKKIKFVNSEKGNKSKKSDKSHISKIHHNNPQLLSNRQKSQCKVRRNLLIDDIRKPANKYISLQRKSYYLIGFKNNKNRSLNKEKKKNKSLRQEANVILTNGQLVEYSSSAPSNCRNTSLTSTVNSKIKAESCKNQNDRRKQQIKSEYQTIAQKQTQLFEIVKKTGQILDKYKGQCIQLKKQKQQFQEKYEQAIKKLNRFREQIQFVMKTE